MQNNRDRLFNFIKDKSQPGLVASPCFDEQFVAGVVGKEWTCEVTWQEQADVMRMCGEDCLPIYLIHGRIGLDYSEENSELHWKEEIVSQDEDRIDVRRTLKTPYGEISEVLGTHIHGGPTYLETALKTEADYPAVYWFLERIAECPQTIKRAVAEAKSYLGDSGLLSIFCFQPYEGYALVDFAEMFLRQYDFPEKHETFKKLVFAGTNTIITAAIEAGCEVIWIGCPGAGLLSPEIFEEDFIPPTHAYVELIRKLGGISYFHFCGYKQVFFDNGMINQIATDILEGFTMPPTGDLKDFGQAREQISPAVCTRGNLDLDMLRNATPDVVYEACINIAEQTKGYRHMVGGNCSLLNGTPVENVQAIAKAAKDFSDLLFKEHGVGVE